MYVMYGLNRHPIAPKISMIVRMHEGIEAIQSSIHGIIVWYGTMETLLYLTRYDGDADILTISGMKT